MSLEIVVNVLGKAMHGDLASMDRNLLRDEEIRSVLTTYFSEREVRPELVAVIRAPSLMKEYLGLSLEERAEVDTIREINPGFLDGEENTKKRISLDIRPASQLARKISYASTVLAFFDKFMKERKPYDFFNISYFQRRCGKAGIRLDANVRDNLAEEGGFDYLLQLASEINPEIKRYSTFKGVLIADGPTEIIGFFDTFLKERKPYDFFNISYIGRKCGKSGGRLKVNVNRNLKEEGGIQYLVQLVAEERLDILEHWKYGVARAGRKSA